MVPLLALALAAAVPSVDARYRVEIGGAHVGWARLATRCDAGGCEATWESVLRSPAEAGGRNVEWHTLLATEPDGRARRVRVRIVADGWERRRAADAGPVPASLATLLLAGAAEGERRCLAVREEESGAEGPACVVRRGAWLEGDVAGVPVRFRATPGEAPAEVELPGQVTRFVRDPAAALPAQAPRLAGARAPREQDGRVCDRAADALAAPPAGTALPATFPPGASCRERTARYLAVAATAGFRGRHAIGVAHDGQGLVWHEWAELQVGDRWIAVDPSFEQLPAAGRRFTIARYEDGDEKARARAGRAVLPCWIGGGSGEEPAR